MIATATTSRITARGSSDSSATSLRAITMISAERMKSVRIALETMLSSASGPTSAASSCSSWPLSRSQTFSAPS